MKKPLYFILLLFIPFALLSGCSQDTAPKSEGPVIAEVDGNPITEGDFIKEISRVPEWAREQFKDDEGKKEFIDELVKRELIYQHAQKMKLDNDADYLSKVEEFKKMTLVSIVLKKEVEEKSAMDDSEVKAFFDQNADKFTIGTKIKASHILVGTEEEAKNVTEKLNKGEKFEKLAKELSKDTGSAPKGGDLGYFGRGQMVPEFEQAALSLKPGEVSAPVKTRFGFHVIKLVDIKKGEPANFDQSKDSIKKQLLGEKRKKIFDGFVNKLKSDAKVSTNDDTIAGLTLPWEQAAPAPAEAAPVPETAEQK
jgi:peptidyl-prolyl cis-trans isomerase C